MPWAIRPSLSDPIMFKNSSLLALAFLSGTLLTLMLQINSSLAHSTSPMIASWVAHGVGMLSTLMLILLFRRNTAQVQPMTRKPPLIYYLGGIVGAFTVILAAMTVNGGMPLSSVVALSLVGQIVFSLFSDQFGFLGSTQRRISLNDIFAVMLVLGGSLMVILDLRNKA